VSFDGLQSGSKDFFHPFFIGAASFLSIADFIIKMLGRFTNSELGSYFLSDIGCVNVFTVIFYKNKITWSAMLLTKG